MTVNLIGGDWQFTAPTTFGIDAATSINIGTLSGSNGATINLGLSGPGMVLANVNIQSNEINLFSLDSTTINVNSTFSVYSNGGDVLIGTSGGLNVTLGQNTPSAIISLNSPAISMQNIPSGSAANILYIDPTTFQLSQAASSGLLAGTWLVGNNTGLSSPANFGTNDAVEVDMYCNGTLMMVLDTSGHVDIVQPLVTINTVQFQDGFTVDSSTTTTFQGTTTTVNFANSSVSQSNVNIATGWHWLWESGAQIIANSGALLNWGATADFSGTTNVSGAFNVTGAFATTLSQNVINIGETNTGSLNIGNSATSITVVGSGMTGTFTGAAGFAIGSSGAGGINIQSSGTAPFLIGSGASGTFSIVNLATQTGTVGSPTHTPPSGFNYLAINTTTGQVVQFSA